MVKKIPHIDVILLSCWQKRKLISDIITNFKNNNNKLMYAICFRIFLQRLLKYSSFYRKVKLLTIKYIFILNQKKMHLHNWLTILIKKGAGYDKIRAVVIIIIYVCICKYSGRWFPKFNRKKTIILIGLTLKLPSGGPTTSSELPNLFLIKRFRKILKPHMYASNSQV